MRRGAQKIYSAAPTSATRGSEPARARESAKGSATSQPAAHADAGSDEDDALRREARNGVSDSPAAPKSSSRYSADPRMRAAQAWAEKSGAILRPIEGETPVTRARMSPVDEDAERRRQEDAEAEERRQEWIRFHVAAGDFSEAVRLGWRHDVAAKRIGRYWISALRRRRAERPAPSGARTASNGDVQPSRATIARAALPPPSARPERGSAASPRADFGAMRAAEEERVAEAVQQLRAQLDRKDAQLRQAHAELAAREQEHERLTRELHLQVDQALTRVSAEAKARGGQAAQVAALQSKLQEDVAREREAAAVARAHAAEEVAASAKERDAALARADALALRLAEAEAQQATLRRAAADVQQAAGALGSDASHKLSAALGVLETEREAHAREVRLLRAQLGEREAAVARALDRQHAQRASGEVEAAQARADEHAHAAAAAEGALSGYGAQLQRAQAQLEEMQAKRAEGARAVLAEVESLERELALLSRRARDERADAAAARQLHAVQQQQLLSAKAETERALVQQMERSRRALADLEARHADALGRRELECARREAAAEQRATESRREADGLRELLQAARDEAASSAARAASEARGAREAEARAQADAARARAEAAALLGEAHAREEEVRARADAAEADGAAAARALGEADAALEAARAEAARARGLAAELERARAESHELRELLLAARAERDGEAGCAQRERERCEAAEAMVDEADEQLTRARAEAAEAAERAARAEAAQERAEALLASAQPSLLRLAEQVAELEEAADGARAAWREASAQLEEERRRAGRAAAEAFAEGAASAAAADSDRALASVALAAAAESAFGERAARLLEAGRAARAGLADEAAEVPLAAPAPGEQTESARAAQPAAAGGRDGMQDAALWASVLARSVQAIGSRLGSLAGAQQELGKALQPLAEPAQPKAPPASRARVEGKGGGSGAALLARATEAQSLCSDLSAELPALRAALLDGQAGRPQPLSAKLLAIAVRRLAKLGEATARLSAASSEVANGCQAMAGLPDSALPAGALAAARKCEQEAAALARAPLADASGALQASGAELPQLARERAALGLGAHADAADSAAARAWLSVIAAVALCRAPAAAGLPSGAGARAQRAVAELDPALLPHAAALLTAAHAREPAAPGRGAEPVLAARFASGGAAAHLPARLSAAARAEAALARATYPLPASRASPPVDELGVLVERASRVGSSHTLSSAELIKQRQAVSGPTSGAAAAAARRRAHQAALAGYAAAAGARNARLDQAGAGLVDLAPYGASATRQGRFSPILHAGAGAQS